MMKTINKSKRILLLTIITASALSSISVRGRVEEEGVSSSAAAAAVDRITFDETKKSRSRDYRRRSLLPDWCEDDRSFKTEKEYPDLPNKIDANNKKKKMKKKKRKKKRNQQKVVNSDNNDEEVELKKRKCGWVKRDPTRRCDALGRADGVDGTLRANVACARSCRSCFIEKDFEEYQSNGNCHDANDLVYEAIMGGKYYCPAEEIGGGKCHEEPPRYFQYDSRTDRVVIRGESYHGTDYEKYADWWICGLTYAQNYWGESGDGFIEYIMDHSIQSQEEQLQQAIDSEYPYRPSKYYRYTCRIAILQPDDWSMNVWANKATPSVYGGYETTKPNDDNYNLLWTGKRDDAHWTFSYCYKEKSKWYSKQMFFAVNGKAIENANNGTIPPGDGTDERDNGVRVDMLFRTTLVLSNEDKCKLKQRYKHLIIPIKRKFKKTTPYEYDPTADCDDC